jgi:hypothetical protein
MAMASTWLPGALRKQHAAGRCGEALRLMQKTIANTLPLPRPHPTKASDPKALPDSQALLKRHAQHSQILCSYASSLP